jgi:hypothetical protein
VPERRSGLVEMPSDRRVFPGVVENRPKMVAVGPF